MLALTLTLFKNRFMILCLTVMVINYVTFLLTQILRKVTVKNIMVQGDQNAEKM